MQQRYRRSLKLCYRLQVRAGQGREPQGQGGHQQSGENIDSLASPSILTFLIPSDRSELPAEAERRHRGDGLHQPGRHQAEPARPQARPLPGDVRLSLAVYLGHFSRCLCL